MRGIFTPFFKKYRANRNALCGFGNICLSLPSVKSMTVARNVGNRQALETGGCQQQADFGNKRVSAISVLRQQTGFGNKRVSGKSGRCRGFG